MVKKAEIPGHIVECALALAAGTAWRRVTLGDIAREAGLSLAQLHEHYPSKGAILEAYVDRVDRAMLRGRPRPTTCASVSLRPLVASCRALSANRIWPAVRCR